MARLRRVVAQIEGEAGETGERAGRRLSLTGALDSALGGGLADDALHEIAPAEPQDGAAAMGFALALAGRFLSRRPATALIVGDGFAAHEAGALYGPGLVAHGLPLSRLVFVQAPDAASAFWAMEEALKCGAPAAVVGEIWNLKGYSLTASRRLLLAARKGRTPALLILASAYGQAERISSAAESRFEIAALPSAKVPAAAGRDLPGPFACGARLVKARLGPSTDGCLTARRETDALWDRAGRASQPVERRASFRTPSEPVERRASFRTPYEARLEALDPTRVFRLEWRSEELAFDDPAISLPLAAATGDRPRAAASWR